MLRYDFIVEYRKGKETKAVDALSRVEEGAAMAISEPRPTWIETVKEEYS